MKIDDAIEIKKPEPDSHFRLSACRCCEGDNVAYVKILCSDGVERWRVECFDCGHRSAGFSESMHDIQMIWNEVMVRRGAGREAVR